MQDRNSSVRFHTAARWAGGMTLLVLTLLVPWHANAMDPEVPYDLEKFRPVLDASKLQAPTSSPALIEHGEFAGQSNQYFFLDETKQYMTFTITGDSRRSELRQLTGTDWDTSTTTPQRMVARVRVFDPQDEGLNQFTFLQIHDTTNDPQSLNKPLIRITRRGDYRSTDDHLWAHIRTPGDFSQPISLDNLATVNVDLGPRPEGFFDAEIYVKDSRMKVFIDDQMKLDMDVSYWDGLNNYFKAGVYNQDPGTSMVQFDELRYLDTEDIAALAGDYNANGQVEQGDLDLVLQNWGVDTSTAGVPAGWTNDLPSGQIEQTELDDVLQNWGGTSASDFAGSTVPEPAGFVVLATCFSVLSRRAAARPSSSLSLESP